jgi:hypothetical protein
MEWIWTDKVYKNQYVEFIAEFTAPSKDCKLRISADTEYVVWINGEFTANGQYADYPYYKVYDEVDISSFVTCGKNRLAILAWHMGEDVSTHFSKCAAICFCIIDAEERVLEKSGVSTLCRISKGYRQDIQYMITPQLGYAWGYDFTREDEWKNSPEAEFAPAVVVKTKFRLYPRPIQKCEVKRVVPSKICAQGIYMEKGEGGWTPAERMQSAWMSTKTYWEMTGEPRRGADELEKPVRFKTYEADGIYLVIDLKEERAGYPIIDLEVSESCMMYFGYGEHLADLRTRMATGGRNFTFEIHLKEGRNYLAEYTRRLGARYLMLFVSTRSFLLHKASLVSCEYPFPFIKKKLKDRFLQKIYDAGVRTLKLCAHEHYEDCPWREQALYAMDSRNQMLFGYSVFGEYEMPRASLRLMAYSQQIDGLLALCAPARTDITIPSFSLYWIIALCENAEVDFQKEFIKEMVPYAEKILVTFEQQLTDTGVKSFRGAQYWNFYEWSDGLEGGALFTDKNDSDHGLFSIAETCQTKDLILTALFYLATKKLFELEYRLKRMDQVKTYEILAQKAYRAAEAFYCTDTGLYASFINQNGKQGTHGYTLSLLICLKMIPTSRIARIAEALQRPPKGMVTQTFATLQWKYDAIIDATKDVDGIIDEICDVFGRVLLEGGSTFPETEDGERDFEDAGSLCHAWAAVPCYIFNKYLTE